MSSSDSSYFNSDTKFLKYVALIVAGGCGSRMDTDIPKQFLLLKQKPILMHTIEAFYHSDLKPEIILVLNIDLFTYWEELCQKYKFTIPHQMVKGGSERFYSVKNGLKVVKNKNTIVAIHDAVRPLISNQTITNSFIQANLKGTAVTAVRSKESVRQICGDTSVSINRDNIYLIQTPQTFKSDIIKSAYRQPYQLGFTDDASVVEKYGVAINLIPGESKNIKITFPEDIIIAESYLLESVF